MKKLVLSLLFILVTGLIFSQTLKKGMVVAVSTYNLTLRDDVSLDQFIRFNDEKYIPELEKAMPGTKIYQLIGDRGENKYHWGEMVIFDDVATRDKYYPVENDTAMSPAIKGIMPVLQSLSQESSKYVLNADRIYTDWIIGDTPDITLNKGTVIALSSYDMHLKNDVSFRQYTDFTVKKYNPALEAAMPGSRLVTLWGDRGYSKYHPGEMWIFDNADVRNKYFPSENETQNSPVLQTALDKVKPLSDEGNKYVLDSQRTYTDWIIK
jgi:hypothetical protein